MRTKAISYRKQFRKCRHNGLTTQTADSTTIICGKFGGICSNKNRRCRRLRQLPFQYDAKIPLDNQPPLVESSP